MCLYVYIRVLDAPELELQTTGSGHVDTGNWTLEEHPVLLALEPSLWSLSFLIMCGHVHMSADAHRGQKSWIPQELRV